MATTRKTTRRRASSRKADDGIAARTGRTIKQRPYTSAAIATGAVTAVAAAVAGLFFFRRSERSLGELTGDLTSKVKDGLSEAGDKIRSATRREPKADLGDKSQSDIAEEALTLKETGKKPAIPEDPALADRTH
jgi:hypothetical protein